LNDLIQKYPTTLPAARAHLILGEIALADDHAEDALAEFQAYAAARPGVIDHYIYEKIGDLLSEDVQTEAAFEAYKTAYLAAPSPKTSPLPKGRVWVRKSGAKSGGNRYL
jgi:TolA-binding protein